MQNTGPRAASSDIDLMVISGELGYPDVITAFAETDAKGTTQSVVAQLESGLRSRVFGL